MLSNKNKPEKYHDLMVKYESFDNAQIKNLSQAKADADEVDKT